MDVDGGPDGKHSVSDLRCLTCSADWRRPSPAIYRPESTETASASIFNSSGHHRVIDHFALLHERTAPCLSPLVCLPPGLLAYHGGVDDHSDIEIVIRQILLD